MTNRIITISREYGSGGRTVGELVAKKLGIPFYDKEVVNAMAESCGFSHEFIEEMGEYATVTNSFLYSIAISARAETGAASAADQLYACQSNYIRELAKKGPCVIVGRCADYILRDQENVIHAFIYADMDFRAKHMVEHYDKPEKSIVKWLKDKDSKRKVYCRHYTGRTWGEAKNYDICLSTSAVGIETAADILVALAQK